MFITNSDLSLCTCQFKRQAIFVAKIFTVGTVAVSRVALDYHIIQCTLQINQLLVAVGSDLFFFCPGFVLLFKT